MSDFEIDLVILWTPSHTSSQISKKLRNNSSISCHNLYGFVSTEIYICSMLFVSVGNLYHSVLKQGLYLFHHRSYYVST
jgi:hypothetical protein